MAYTKTAWVEGALPAINATNLNKIEQGIADAHNDLIGNVTIVEEGANANGHYVRYSNGVQECWANPFSQICNVANGAIYRSETDFWTFPAAFLEANPVIVTGTASGLNRWIGATGTASGGSIGIRTYATISSTTLISVWLRAIGRWK